MRFVQVIPFLFLALALSPASAMVSSRRPTINRLSRTLLRQNALITRRTLPTFAGLQRRIIARRSCAIRLCFALEGSTGVSRSDLNAQRDFIGVVSGIVSIDRSARFAALQYGLSNVDITRPVQLPNFLRRVSRASLVNAPRKFVAAGVGGCARQLGAGSANGRIVVIGDGRSDFGGSINVATQFRGQISAVAIGRNADVRALRTITGGGDVFRRNSYRAIGGVVDDVVRSVCGF